MIDMIGFGIVIPFLTYLVEDLAASEELLVGLWVGNGLPIHPAQFLFSPFWGSVSTELAEAVLMVGLVGKQYFLPCLAWRSLLIARQQDSWLVFSMVTLL